MGRGNGMDQGKGKGRLSEMNGWLHVLVFYLVEAVDAGVEIA